MRGLPEPQQNAIYDQVRIGIDATKAKAGKVKTITGSEEGLYSWANINYLQGNFEPNSTQIQTNGVYEVGGASAQIAFQISDGLKYGSYENKTSFNHHEVKVNNKSYNVVSISHLGLGQNEVRASLMQENNNYNSCYPTGYNQAESKGATPPILAVKGKFDYQSCSNVLNESINNFLYVNTLNTIPGFYDVKFIGLSGVTNALKFWGLDKDFNKPKELEKAINQTCPLYSWVLAQGLTTKSISKFDNVACQNAVYINNMLYNHFKFAPDQIKGVETINGQTPTWTQGFVVVE